ncbi:MAG: ester cyclase [Thaumarchaeota archaeon]|nr:MAG: ester cyclase [Nitrososphaerota archaeon]
MLINSHVSRENDNIQLVRRALNTLNAGDTTNVSEFISPAYFNLEMDPVRSKMRGPQEFIDTVMNIQNAFSDLYYEELESIASDKKVVSIVTVAGKHTGSFFGSFYHQGTKFHINRR